VQVLADPDLPRHFEDTISRGAASQTRAARYKRSTRRLHDRNRSSAFVPPISGRRLPRVYTPRMTLTLADLLAGLMFTAVGAGIGAFLGSYLKQKGENLASKEDLAIAVEQLRATTTTVEGIKTQLAERTWVSQERWKMRSELYVAYFNSSTRS
jgi:hypothetical protein